MAATETSIELTQLAQAYGDAWNSQDLEDILAFHADDCTFELHTGAGPAIGKQAVREAFAAFLAPWAEAEWVVYAKEPFGAPEEVLRYLSRYTHRVAISNRRLVSADDAGVTASPFDPMLVQSVP